VRSAGDAIARSLRAVAAAFLVVIVALDVANVFGRYLLSAPISWAEEVMLFLMIGAVFVMLAPVSWDGAHVRMDILVRSLPGAVRRVVEVLADLVSFSVTALLAYASVPVIVKLVEFEQRSHATGLPMALPQGSVPLGLGLAALALAARRLSGRAAAADGKHGLL